MNEKSLFETIMENKGYLVTNFELTQKGVLNAYEAKNQNQTLTIRYVELIDEKSAAALKATIGLDLATTISKNLFTENKYTKLIENERTDYISNNTNNYYSSYNSNKYIFIASTDKNNESEIAQLIKDLNI